MANISQRSPLCNAVAHYRSAKSRADGEKNFVAWGPPSLNSSSWRGSPGRSEAAAKTTMKILRHIGADACPSSTVNSETSTHQRQLDDRCLPRKAKAVPKAPYMPLCVELALPISAYSRTRKATKEPPSGRGRLEIAVPLFFFDGAASCTTRGALATPMWAYWWMQ